MKDGFGLVARIECADDVREEYLRGGQDGSMTVREVLTGPSARLAFDTPVRRMEVALAPEAAPALAEVLRQRTGSASLWEYLNTGRADVLDLMDLCDREQVPYAFSVRDGGDVIAFRPSRRSRGLRE